MPINFDGSSYYDIDKQSSLPVTVSTWFNGNNYGSLLALRLGTLSQIPAFGGFTLDGIDAGRSHMIGRRTDGTAWTWGSNDASEIGSPGIAGQLGDNTVTYRSSPVSVVGGHSFVEVSASGFYCAGLKEDGTLWTWGANPFGGLGDNTTTQKSSPVSVVGAHSFVNIRCRGNWGMHALKIDGTVWGWGYNAFGQIGDNTATQRNSPVSIVGAHSFVKITTAKDQTGVATVDANNAGALKLDGSAWMWGNNAGGQIGDGTITARVSPVSVVGGHSFIDIASGSAGSVALKVDGTAWAWGLGTSGQIGDNAASNRSSPVSVVGDHSFVQVAAGYAFKGALKLDGSAWMWGLGTQGQLGDGNVSSRSSPTSVLGGHSFIQLVCSGGDDHRQSMALKANGEVWTWGSNLTGQLGDGTITQRNSPVLVIGGHSFERVTYGVVEAGTNFEALVEATVKFGPNPYSISESLFLKRNGTTWVWGDSANGNLGDNQNSVDASSPVSVVGNHSFVLVSKGEEHAIALKGDGTGWSWGRGTSGEMGDGTATSRSSPVSVIGGHSFLTATNGAFHTVALKSNGTAWAWGLNSGGRVGDNTGTDRSSPVSVVGAHSFIFIDCGGQSAATGALKADGTAWFWGANSNGNLGDNTTTTRSSPVSVIGGHSFIEVRSGASHSLGLKSNGSAWGWGSNASTGKVGDNTTTNRSSPVSVIGEHAFVQLSAGNSHTTALKSDGSAWAWGAATAGKLGDDQDTASRSSPVSVVGGHSFIQVRAGSAFSFALKLDGSIWSWGDNTNGELGDNTTTSRSSPVSVVGGTHEIIAEFDGLSTSIVAPSNVYGEALAGEYSFAKKPDGSAWEWGLTSLSAGIRSSPISVLGENDFVRIANGDSTTKFGIKGDGTAWSWGANSSGSLGTNSAVSLSRSPVSVHGDHSFAQIISSIGEGGGGLKADGSLWTWGENTDGQLGDETVENRSSPISVHGDHSFVFASIGSRHVVALKSDGSTWAWGDNNFSGLGGALGDNTATDRSSPVSVVGAHSFVAVSAGAVHSTALKQDGSAWGWGTNTSGAVGDNTATSRSSPVSVIGGHSFVAISANGYTAALKQDGSAWAWGSNTFGWLGDNTTTSRSSPVSVIGGHSFIAISAGGTHALALKQDGSIWAWGVGVQGILGEFTQAISRSSPVSVVGFNILDSYSLDSRWNHVALAVNQNKIALIVNGNRVHAIRARPIGTAQQVVGADGFSILYNSGQVWSLGSNLFGQVGNGTTDSSLGLQGVIGNHSFTSIDGSVNNRAGLKSDGTIWTWGVHNGESTTSATRSSPVSVAGTHSFVEVGASDTIGAGRKIDGTVWTWGDNSFGYIGDNTTTNRSSPVSIVGAHSFVEIDLGTSHHSARKADGTIWTWGINTGGQLGDNTVTIRSSPVSVIGAHSFIQTSAGSALTGGLKVDGSAWAWGNGANGQLGDNSTTLLFSPVSVIGGHSFVEISTASYYMARKIDGSAWAWGDNEYGNLGDGTTTSRSSPVSVVGAHSFVTIYASSIAAYGIKADGTVWAWGGNASGQLGDFGVLPKSSPVQIGTSAITDVQIRIGADSSSPYVGNLAWFSAHNATLGLKDIVPIVRGANPFLVRGGSKLCIAPLWGLGGGTTEIDLISGLLTTTGSPTSSVESGPPVGPMRTRRF